ncbi:MAG: hypothetical protein AB7D02_00890 [Candidatus Paceibacterota bacterium]
MKEIPFRLKELFFCLFFFLVFGVPLVFFESISFSSFFISFSLSFLFLIFWKIFLGLSWFNFFSLILGPLNLLLIKYWFKRELIFLLFLLFAFLFLKKYFSPFEIQKKWREFIFAFLFWLWIVNSYSFLFILEKPFLFSLCFYLLGLMFFSFLYFVFNYEHFSLLNIKTRLFFALLILINLEFFWLLSFLSLSLFVLSTALLVFFYLFFYYKNILKYFKVIGIF